MFAVLRKRNFALLWLGQIVSLAGDYMLIVALPYYVFGLTGSILQTGTMFVVETVPRILLGSFAGVFVDRWDRRWTMIISDLSRAAVLLLLLLVHSQKSALACIRCSYFASYNSAILHPCRWCAYTFACRRTTPALGKYSRIL